MPVNIYHINSPVKITTTELGIPLDYKQECINQIYNLGDSMGQESNVKAIMSSYHIYNETKVLDPLIKKINNVIHSSVPIDDYRLQYKLVEVWSAIYKKDHYTIPHHHKPRHLSFVYYLKASNISSPLVFNECNFKIQPQDDFLIIFPSHLRHSVPKQTEDEDRICLAGNLDCEII